MSRDANIIKTIADIVSIQETVGAASVQSAALSQGVYDLCSDTDCYIKISAAPTAAAATSYFLPADVIVRFLIEADHKVAHIQKSAGGLLNITEVKDA